MASTSRENNHLLTELELQFEAENLWNLVEDIFGEEESDKDYVKKKPNLK